MGFFTVKTKAVDTTELNFSQLKKQLDGAVTEKRKKATLGDDAQLRFTAGKGLYAKSGTWNVNRLDPFGSGALQRGDKFRGAREEVARSINLSYANQRVNGKYVGDHVVDLILEARAREQLQLGPSDACDPKQIANLKASLHLKYGDIQEIANKITELKKSGAIQKDKYVRLHKGQAPNERLMSSVGHLRGPGQTEQAAERETRKLIDTIVTDLVEHKWSKAMSPKRRETLRDSLDERDQKKYSELNKKIHADAEVEARALLSYKVGMKTYHRGHMEDEEQLHAVPGGLTTENVAIAHRVLGPRSHEVAKLLQSTDLPRHIKACDARLADLGTKLTACANNLYPESIQYELEARLGKDAAWDIDYNLQKVAADIQGVIDDNRAAVFALKEMSFPNDITDPAVRRAHYNTLMRNIENMDQVFEGLNAILSKYEPKNRAKGENAAQAVTQELMSNLANAAQEYCAETLELASGVYPGPPPGKSHVKQPRLPSDANFDRPRPFRLRLKGLMRHIDLDTIENKLKEALSDPIAAPSALFERDLTDLFGVRSSTRSYNRLINKIDKTRNAYRDLLETPLSDRGKSDVEYINRFRKDLIKALYENEKLTELFQRRQEIRGDAPNAEIDQQLQQAKEQRNALLLLLYPRQTQPADDWNAAPFGAPVRRPQQIEIQEDQGLVADDASLQALQQGIRYGQVEEEEEENAPVNHRAGRPVIQREADDSSSVSTDQNSETQINIEPSVDQVNIEQSVDQVVLKHVSQAPPLGAPSDDDDSSKPDNGARLEVADEVSSQIDYNDVDWDPALGPDDNPNNANMVRNGDFDDAGMITGGVERDYLLDKFVHDRFAKEDRAPNKGKVAYASLKMNDASDDSLSIATYDDPDDDEIVATKGGMGSDRLLDNFNVDLVARKGKAPQYDAGADDGNIETVGSLVSDILANGNIDENQTQQEDVAVINNPQRGGRGRANAVQANESEQQGIVGVGADHAPKASSGDVDDPASIALVQNAVIDSVKLLANHEEDYLWLGQLELDDFKDVEPIEEGLRLHDVAKEAYEENERVLGVLKSSADRQTIMEPSVRNTVQADLWKSLETLIDLRQRFDQFVTTLQGRIDNGDYDHNSRAKKQAQTALDAAQKLIDSADKLITGTHSAAYTVSSPEQRNQAMNGVGRYPQSIAENMRIDDLLEYPVSGGKQHSLHEYAQSQTPGAYTQRVEEAYGSTQRLAKAYLASLSKVNKTLEALREVKYSKDRQTRLNMLDMLKNQLIPQLDNALNRNSDVIVMFSGHDFVLNAINDGALDDGRVGVIRQNLEQDRSNIKSLRLNAFLLLRGDDLRQGAA